MEWAPDLVSTDADRRSAAHLVFEERERDVRHAQQLLNDIWREVGALSSSVSGEAAALAQAITAVQVAASRSFLAAAGGVRFAPDDPTSVGHALTFLEWEVRYPDEWPKKWGTKITALQGLTRLLPLPPPETDRLRTLVISVADRPFRTGDQWYARLAQAMHSDTALRRKLDDLAGLGGPCSLRAAFLALLMEDPTMPATPHSWRNFLASRTSPPE